MWSGIELLLFWTPVLLITIWLIFLDGIDEAKKILKSMFSGHIWPDNLGKTVFFINFAIIFTSTYFIYEPEYGTIKTLSILGISALILTPISLLLAWSFCAVSDYYWFLIYNHRKEIKKINDEYERDKRILEKKIIRLESDPKNEKESKEDIFSKEVSDLKIRLADELRKSADAMRNLAKEKSEVLRLSKEKDMLKKEASKINDIKKIERLETAQKSLKVNLHSEQQKVVNLEKEIEALKGNLGEDKLSCLVSKLHSIFHARNRGQKHLSESIRREMWAQLSKEGVNKLSRSAKAMTHPDRIGQEGVELSSTVNATVDEFRQAMG